jgi:tetratricopeptide (TPR) repeat protein
MSNQLEFLYFQAMQCIQGGNLDGSELLLRQILKKKPNHSNALRLLSVIAVRQGRFELALERIEGAIIAGPKNGIAYSNKGNILLALNRAVEAIEAHKKAIKLSPSYAEAYSNLGNVYLEMQDYQLAIDFYKKAINLESSNYDFKVNLGNALWRANLLHEAISEYSQTLEAYPSDANVQFYLAQIELYLGNFKSGWDRYEWRWLAAFNDSQPLKTSKSLWQGQQFDGCLYIWAEQGVGDQILHASIFSDLRSYPQRKLISVEKKLLPILKRSFPDYEFIDSCSTVSEEKYDHHIPIGSLGKIFRQRREDFYDAPVNYLKADLNLSQSIRVGRSTKNKFICGLSWKSSNQTLGKQKSISLMDLSKVLALENLEFINLQYGDVSADIEAVKDSLDIDIHNWQKYGLFEDLEYALSLIDSCDIILTTSNSNAHMAGALGKEVLLLIPLSFGKFWYWHDIHGVSLWYPTIKIFKQEIQGDWSAPVLKIKNYLEAKFAT